MFLLTYTCEDRKLGVKDQITEMAFNSASVRDTARTLKHVLLMRIFLSNGYIQQPV
ncbi:hypothetical protein F6T13_21085 [Escherichia coli]|nr:hypothetical protein [Escherichia coli]EGF7412897.1 hypothetical protein [Escherichia coli]EGF7454045.1 hypothetical protein [Escherichia coli]